MRRVILCCLALVLALNICGGASASTGGNTGLTGLWEYPTAEMPDDGSGRFGFTYNSPYQFYFIDLAWLPWLEINTRLTTFDSIFVNQVDANGPTAYRRYMDKAIDLKFRLWHSKNPKLWFIPSLAVGVVDMMGTELMKAYYGAATWRFGDVALTLGYGDDRFNGLYGGLEWDIADWLTFKAEYSPLDYSYDGVGKSKVLDREPSQKYNVGFVLKAPWGMEGSVSYQRGDNWAFSISQKINLSGPLLGNGHKKFKAPGGFRCATWEDVESGDLLVRIKSGLEKFTRIRDVDIKLDETDEYGRRLSLSYENYGYASHAEAMTRVIIILSSVMPETDSLLLIAKNAGVPVVKAEFPGSLLFDIRNRSLRQEDPIHAAIFSWASRDIDNPDATVLSTKAQHEFKAMLTYDPRIDQTLNKAYMDRLNIDAIYTGRYSGGLGAIADVKFPLYNDIDDENITGLWWEPDLNNDIRIQRAGMTYANKAGESGRLWFFGEGGYLNEEWLGANIWARYYGESGLWWIGARYAALHDRDPWSFGGLTEGKLRYLGGRAFDDEESSPWRNSWWIQAGFNIADLNLDIEADYGRFVDDDQGWKISATRHWDDTAIGFWYIATDIDAPGKDFTKAGVHMEIPADKWFGSWFGNSSAHIWEQDTMFLSTWRMHSGREGGIIRSPERFISQLRPAALRKNVEIMLREYCSYDDIESEEDNTVTSILGYILH